MAKGFVRLIFTEKDLNNFKEGEILVSPMTRPEFLSVMQKALAFVTDEGGITCHAAIIAREMKKPCIISTKIATQVLKDGDLVEVDADNGVVRILERSEKLVGENDKANKKFEALVNNLGMMVLLGLILLVTIGDVRRIFIK